MLEGIGWSADKLKSNVGLHGIHVHWSFQQEAGLRRQCLCDNKEDFVLSVYIHACKRGYAYHAPQLSCHKGQELQELQCVIRVGLPPIGS